MILIILFNCIILNILEDCIVVMSVFIEENKYKKFLSIAAIVLS